MINQFKDEYEFLSNMYTCTIEFKGIVYGSVENAYQAQKTNDVSVKHYIATLPPKKSKTYARKIEIVKNWDSIKEYVMKDLIALKFKDFELRQKLLDTHPHEIVEGNTWNDTFWGWCMKTNKGQNKLGKILMMERNSITLMNILGLSERGANERNKT